MREKLKRMCSQATARLCTKAAAAICVVTLTAVTQAEVALAQVKPPDPSTLKVAATSGAQVYAMTCAACHQANGAGLPSQFPPLASDYVTGDPNKLIHIVLRGLTGEVEVEGEMFKGEMPGWAPALSDAQMAAVLTYIRSSFGNKSPAIAAEDVARVRTQTLNRAKPYTAAEIAAIRTP